MSDSRILRLPAAALLVAVLLTAPVLAGCGALPVPSIGDVGSGSDPGGGDDGVEVATIPADFPAEIPLIEGEVLSGVSLGSEGSKIWSILIKVDDGSSFEQITSQLEAAGFVSSGLGGSTELGSTGVFSKPPYAISLAVSGGADVGWAAKYTVAEDG